jgi:hypothetical protein
MIADLRAAKQAKEAAASTEPRVFSTYGYKHGLYVKAADNKTYMRS